MVNFLILKEKKFIRCSSIIEGVDSDVLIIHPHLFIKKRNECFWDFMEFLSTQRRIINYRNGYRSLYITCNAI